MDFDTTTLSRMADAYYENAGAYGAPSVIMTACDTIKPVPITWLWRDWLPAGKFCLLAGAPGCGKTTLALDLMATITNAGRWPDGSECALPGNCVIWSGEDSAADTLVPRLMAAGVDCSRVYIVQGVRERDDQVRQFDPATDTDALADAVQAIGHVRLVLVDPVSVAVAGDSHRNTETRRGLQPLVDLAANTGACLLGISHLSKANNGGDPASRVVGSIAFTAVARVVLLASKTNSDTRLLVRAKSNVGSDTGGMEYTLEQTEACPGVSASRVVWGQSVTGSAAELLGEQGDGGQVELAQLLQAELVADCWTPAKQVMESLQDAGYTVDQIKRTSRRIGVVKRKEGMSGGWYWRLSPEGSSKNVEECEGSSK